jgi:hypothetical protein
MDRWWLGVLGACLAEADEGSGPSQRRGGPKARPGFGDGQTRGDGG